LTADESQSLGSFPGLGAFTRRWASQFPIRHRFPRLDFYRSSAE
jgi:hypothetical protein